jgi:hypothetical protein
MCFTAVTPVLEEAPLEPRAIDAWVNVNVAEFGRPDYLKQVGKDYFKQGEDFFRNYEVEEMVDMMDGCGVARAILTTDPAKPSEHVMKFPEKHPERFSLGAQLNPRRGMKTIQALESFRRNHPVVLARITPFLFDIPPNDAIYYPVYSKCIELDLAITINTGIPGPQAVVAGRVSPDAQVSEVAPDDLGLPSEALPARADSLHEHAWPEEDHLRVRPSGHPDAPMSRRGAQARPPPGGPRSIPLQERSACVLE